MSVTYGNWRNCTLQCNRRQQHHCQSIHHHRLGDRFHYNTLPLDHHRHCLHPHMSSSYSLNEPLHHNMVDLELALFHHRERVINKLCTWTMYTCTLCASLRIRPQVIHVCSPYHKHTLLQQFCLSYRQSLWHLKRCSCNYHYM